MESQPQNPKFRINPENIHPCYFNCAVAVCILCHFLTLPWVGLQSVIVVFPGHTHFTLLNNSAHNLTIFVYLSVIFFKCYGT